MDNEYNLKRYLNIDLYLKKLEIEKQSIRKELYNQSLCTSITYDELSIHAKAPKIAQLVDDNVEARSLVDKRIKRWEYRRSQFERFLSSLAKIERESLKKGFWSQRLHEKVLDEIHEIETATAFKFGYEPPEERIELANNLYLDIELMAEVL